MPAFTFTSPEGKSYTVNGPDGATKEQAFSILQQQLAAGGAPPSGPPVAPPAPAVRTAQGIPGNVIPPPETEAPSVGGKIRDAIGVGVNLASDAIEGVTGMVGAGAGMLGGLAGALGVRLRGGVQPDENALDEATAQGAQTAIGGVRAAANLATSAGPLKALRGVAETFQTPGARDIANTIEAPGGVLSNIDPQMGIVMGPAGEAAMQAPGAGARMLAAPVGRAVAPVGRAVGRAVAPVVQKAADLAAPVVQKATDIGGAVVQKASEATEAAGSAAKNVATGAAKAIVNPDPELVKIAQLNDTLEHPLPITANKLSLESRGSTNAAQVKAGDEAVTQNLIGLINPEETATRLTPKVLDTALDRSGGIIGDIAEKTPIPAPQMDTALSPLVKTAVDEGAGDVPRVIPNLAQSLLDTATEGGTIPGAAFRKWDSNIGAKIRSTTDGGLRDELMGLQRSARDVMASNITDPEDVTALKAARQQYAYGQIVAPDVASSVTGLYPADQLMNRVTANARGKRLMATDSGGPIGDLAKVAEMYTRKVAPHTGEKPITVQGILSNSAKGMLNTAATVTGAKAAGRAVANKASQGVARMLTPRVEKPPVAAPRELELAPPGALEPRGAPPSNNPLGDLTPEWETSPGAAAPDTRGAPIDATGLHPALGEEHQAVLPQGTGPGREIPAVPGRPGEVSGDHALGDLTPEWATGGPAATPIESIDATGLHPALGENPTSTGSRGVGTPGGQIPAVPGRPDLPDTMVSGRPGETAASEAANAAMHEPGAVAARAAQEAASRATGENTAAAEAARPKPSADEQARLNEIDKALRDAQSPIVRDTLQKERARVEKDVAARDTLEKTKAAADELRATAAKITDPMTKKAMLQRADKLDPPKPEPKAKPEETPLPEITYADTVEWRTAHGLGDADAQRALLTRKALDIDPKTVEAAAVQYKNSPRAFDRVVNNVLMKETPNADELKLAAEGGEKSGASAQQSSGAVRGTGQQRGANRPGTAPANGQGHLEGGQAKGNNPDLSVEDPAAEAARLAKFHLDHPRATDGTFTEKE